MILNSLSDNTCGGKRYFLYILTLILFVTFLASWPTRGGGDVGNIAAGNSNSTQSFVEWQEAPVVTVGSGYRESKNWNGHWFARSEPGAPRDPKNLPVSGPKHNSPLGGTSVQTLCGTVCFRRTDLAVGTSPFIALTATNPDSNLANNSASQGRTVNGDPGAIRDLSGFLANTLARNDDSSTAAVPVGFTLNFLGMNYSNLFVNNNGNVTFDAALGTFTPFPLTSTQRVIIAAFFADVDTRADGSGVVTYGNDTVSGRQAFGINWVNVGYYNGRTDKLNSFQLVLINRSDTGPGNFDIEFNYNRIQWETGDASGGVGGLGGSSARVGFSNGSGLAGTFAEVTGSAINGAFLDSNTSLGLIHNSVNSNQLGRYVLAVRGGAPPSADLEVTLTDLPDPVSINSNLTYTLVVRNNGPAPANGVTAVDTLPASVNFVSAVPTQGNCSRLGNVVTCSLGSVATNATATATIVVTPTVVGSASNVVNVTSNESDPNIANNTDTETTTITAKSISGRVLDESGSAIVGTGLSLTGSATLATTTDTSGNYSFPNLITGGSYAVTPSSSNYSFSPSNHAFTNLSVNRIANFVGTQTLVNISGNVVDGGNVPLNNVTVALTKNGLAAGTTTTNVLGNYSFQNQTVGANYVVTPSGSFAPSSQILSNLTTNGFANFKAAQSIPTQCNIASLAAATNFLAGANPISVAAGDFNNDGRLDLTAANFGSNSVSILIGSGNGSFGGATNFAVGTSPSSLVTRDFNNDGNIDVAVANNGSNNVSVLLGTGTGSLGAASNFAAGSFPGFLVAADFNGDGNGDLAVANRGSHTLSILLGSGTGGFNGAPDVPTDAIPQSVATGDFNNDGNADLVVANSGFGPDEISVFLGAGNGTFAAALNVASGSSLIGVGVADFNGDGKLDVAIANNATNNVTVLLGNGLGAFVTGAIVPAGVNPFSVSAGDLNGDGKLDLAVANNGSNNVSVLLGDGLGGFAGAVNFASLGTSPGSVVVNDLNDDGRPDIVVANCACRPSPGTSSVSVFLNNATSCNTQTSLAISGQIKAANNSPLPDVTVTLSGPITRVVQTDANGNYSFANLAPGGNYAVTVQSPHYVFAPSRSDFFNLGSSQTANFTAAPVAVPVPTPPLSDNFATPVRDASKWNLGTQTQPVGAFDPQVTTAQINGQLIITPLNQASGSHFNGYVSANSFDLTNGKASVELVRAAPGGADTIFAIGRDSNNFFRFQVHTAGGPSSPVRFYRGLDGVERALDATTSQLLLTVAVQGQLQTLPITYDPVAHRHLRFRHESAQLAPPLGAIVFEASPNGVDYTVLHRVQLANRVVDPMTLELSAGTANPTGTGSAIFDNVGLVLSTFQFSAASYTVGEGDGQVVITVTRTGTLTDSATVEFETADGTAEQRTKYVNATGTLSFAAGETTKTFTVLIVNNVLTEGNQTANLLLEEPDNAGLNSPGRAVLNIIDNDTVTATGNPLDDPTYFVTQQYYDFLNRVADPGGSAFWIDQITSCPPGNQECVNARRIRVSHAFFFEQEFQQTGAFVFRLYRAAFGNQQPFPNPFPDANHPGEAEKVPSYAVFVADRARVIGGSELTQTQLQLANDFVERAEFKTKYPAHLDGPAFITALLQTIQTSTGANLSSQQSVLQALFTQGGRGLVLFHVANDYWNNCHRLPGSPPAPCVPPGVGPALDNRPFIDAEYRRVFVTTQYFGYLRRDADLGGLLFWLDQVNRFPLRDQNIQNAMVCSFITSAEYQQRFSPVVTHTNQECPQ